MQKQAPTLGRLAVMTLFALSCFLLAVFLWVPFGGPTPLLPKPYRIQVPFDEATQLATQADVRISGVSIGKVAKIDLPPDGDRAMATLDIDGDYAPLPSDIKAILRAKTLLGETYIELTPGSASAPKLAEDSVLPEAQVAQTVQLDEILRSLDAPTRTAFKTWMRDSSIAIDGRGQALGDSFATLPDTFRGFDQIFRTLDTQKSAVRQLFANGATTFDAISERRDQLQGLIRNTNAVVTTTAARDQRIIDLFHVFPTFLDESRLTLARLREFSENADPLMTQLTPAARELSPTLISLGRLAPQLRGTFAGLRPVIRRAPVAFPALQRLFAKDFPPLLRTLDPFLRNFNPLLAMIKDYRHELGALLGNAASATNGRETGSNARYLRTLPVMGPDTLAAYPERLNTSRTNPYPKPGAYSELAAGLKSFVTYQCSGGISADLDMSAASDPDFNARTGGNVADAQELLDLLQEFTLNNETSTGAVAAPGCDLQDKFKPYGGKGPKTHYPQVLELPKK